MAKSIHCRRTSHLNVVLEDYDASLAHFQDIYGAEFLLDLPKTEWHACLIEIGNVMFEIFAPHNFLLNSRHGPHYQGIEYEAEMKEVREVIAALGVRNMRELQVALHTDPADCYGADLEFYEGSFWDNNPPHLTNLAKPISYWRDEHPLGLTGLKAYTFAVPDIDAASKFFQSFIGGEPVYEAARPAIGARAVGLKVADSVLELVTPVGDGTLMREMMITGQGIRSTVFRTRNLEQARRHLASKGLELVPGSAPDTFAVPAAANRGLLFEFSE
jgi:hypothetical protein